MDKVLFFERARFGARGVRAAGIVAAIVMALVWRCGITAFVVAASDAVDVSASVSVLNLEGPANVTMDVKNDNTSVTGCVAVSGAVTWKRRNGYKWGDGTFGKGRP